MEKQGRAWGSASTSFEIPGVRLRFSGLSSRQLESLQIRYPDFCKGDKDGTVTHDLECRSYRLTSSPEFSLGQLTRDDQYAPLIKRDIDSITINGIDFKARFGLGSFAGFGDLGVMPSYQRGYCSAVENFLRIYCAYNALNKGGVLVHSAGLISDNLSYIFSGRSGAGKTTLTRKAHAAGMNILSDDINLLSVKPDGVYYTHKVPFTGEFGRTVNQGASQDAYPLMGIIFLEQGNKLMVSSVKKSVAVAKLLTSCPFVNNDDQETVTLFDIISDLVRQVPVVRLHTHRDDDIDNIIDLVKNELKGEYN